MSPTRYCTGVAWRASRSTIDLDEVLELVAAGLGVKLHRIDCPER
jgi:hypothetical protein